MNLNHHHRFLLKSIVEVSDIAAAKYALWRDDRELRVTRGRDIRDFDNYGINYRPASWFETEFGERPTPSEIVMISRALAQLMRADLVIGTGSPRVTEVKLTPNGEAIARQIAGKGAFDGSPEVADFIIVAHVADVPGRRFAYAVRLLADDSASVAWTGGTPTGPVFPARNIAEQGGVDEVCPIPVGAIVKSTLTKTAGGFFYRFRERNEVLSPNP